MPGSDTQHEPERHPRGGSGATAGSEEEDKQWMFALSQGSTEAFDRLFARYKQPIFGFFCRRVQDPGQAEELTQETFLALFRSAPRYEPRALFRTYLYAIALKLLRAHRRTAVFRATFFLSDSDAHEPSTPNTMDNSLLLREALGKLEPNEREILMLREFEQLSYAEIADLLRLPINTVRSRLFRARTALHDLLAAPAPPAPVHYLASLKERV